MSLNFSDSKTVNVDIPLTIHWSNIGGMITSNIRITVSEVNRQEETYTASLTYSPIATSDSGLITATVTISPSDDFMCIESVTATATEMLIVWGKHFSNKIFCHCEGVYILL